MQEKGGVISAFLFFMHTGVSRKYVIRTTVKIFQFLHSPYRISGQYVLCRKENLIVREYNYFFSLIYGLLQKWQP